MHAVEYAGTCTFGFVYHTHEGPHQMVLGVTN